MEVTRESFEHLLQYAYDKQATDVHLCAGAKPLMRLNGDLVAMPDTEMIFGEHVDNILKLILTESQLLTLEKDRVLDFSFSIPGIGRFRANAYSQRGTFALAIRRLPFDIPQFGDLGLPDVVKTFTDFSQGLVLATGATGSGKSTTLASLVNIISKKYPYHIITIEDPIEYLHRHENSLVTQREIGEDAKGFSDALRSALREDPDVIMVGEMRDPETISIALTAAETGHLVLSTLHTMGASKSIDRIVDAFPPTQQNQIKSQLSTVLEGVVSQQLIPSADKKRLVVASEVMVVNPAIRNLIREGKHYQINSIMQTGHSSGMQLLEEDLARLVKSGDISKREAILHAQDPQLLQLFFSRLNL